MFKNKIATAIANEVASENASLDLAYFYKKYVEDTCVNIEAHYGYPDAKWYVRAWIGFEEPNEEGVMEIPESAPFIERVCSVGSEMKKDLYKLVYDVLNIA